MNHQVYLSLGSNIGVPKENIQRALGEINNRTGKITATSSLYETKPLKTTTPILQKNYANLVLQLETPLSPQKLLSALLNIESDLGRVRDAQQRWGPRIIDIDILLFAKVIIKEKNLNIPHPEIANRDFILYPLSEIDPHCTIPGVEKSLPELIASFREDQKTILEVGELHNFCTHTESTRRSK